MKPHYEYPLLRNPIDIRLVEQAEGEILILSCPLQLTDKPLALISGVGPVLAELNGKCSAAQIVSKFSEHGLSNTRLMELLALLDEHLFLHSPDFEERRTQEVESFRTSSIRPAALAGILYPATKDKLENAISNWWKASGGRTTTNNYSKNHLTLLKSPHIDYDRGHLGYTAAYQALNNADHDLMILAGTAHQYSNHLFHCTLKHFETPLGMINCDSSFASELCSLYGKDRALADEYLHKREHSLELQLPFYKHRSAKAPVVPVLVGSFYQFLVDEQSPEHYEAYDAFASALTTLLSQRISQGQRIGFIAGVDMAHVGKHFGDSFELTPTITDGIAERDHAYLDCIAKLSKEKLFEHIAEDQDARRICGFPTMYLLLDVIERLGIKVTPQQFAYHQALSTEQQCLVSFAAMGLYSEPLTHDVAQ
jgi:MEMO1 family protein